MKKVPFYQIDVFTDIPLGGNPLALFPEVPGWSDEVLLKIAREMNLSETVFLFPPEDSSAHFKMRIFTPEKEIPFAGHPVIGTSFAIFEKRWLGREIKELVLKLPIGLISVALKEDGISCMQQPQPQFLDIFEDIDLLADSLGIDSEDITPSSPAQVVSTGFPCLFVPLNSLNAMKRLKVNSEPFARVLQQASVDMIYAFSQETELVKSTVHSRSFAPLIGIPEDPATGSAAGALGAYLLSHGIIAGGKILIEQGYEINRPSCIFVEVSKKSTSEWKIEVGGKSVFILEGQIGV
ncbi:MAG: phenazine biosynthesis protein [Nitrospinae bacterium CG11_big_fil_rev_8_21_14_0_20_45_15]|nr:MAG: phenazine biosynthesis protein [Nitrospinae bacterium CG11_big_fil_rev_8_21_14_0_20_45_15]